MTTDTSTSGAVALYFGPQPMDFMSKAIKVCGKNAVIDPDVAHMAGAMTAIGMPEHLAILRERLMAGALQKEFEKHGGNANPATLIQGAVEWLANGQRGSSSEALFTRLSGINATRGAKNGIASHDHPYDPADLRRCRLMLEQCPTLQLEHAIGLSKEWDALIANWEGICRTMDEEVPDWRNPKQSGSAPLTYNLIKKAIGR